MEIQKFVLLSINSQRLAIKNSGEPSLPFLSPEWGSGNKKKYLCPKTESNRYQLITSKTFYPLNYSGNNNIRTLYYIFFYKNVAT